MKTDVFRNGKIHVMKAQCSTCIFRPGNLMRLERGRVKSMVAGATKNESCIPCHQTTYGGHPDGEAVCHGFFKLHPTLPLKVAVAMKRIAFVEPKKEER